MTNFKIALCQMNVVDDKDENIQKAVEMIGNSKKANVDIAILPEMFNCPYENEKFVEYAEYKDDSYTLKPIANIAKSKNIHVLAGSIPEKELNKRTGTENIYNTSFLFDNNGEILGYHRKMHLFDIDVKDKIYFKESDTLSSGNNITVIDTKSKIGKIGIGICYDIRFPELSRLMSLRGADILIFPGAFNLTTGPAHWELLFRTRALDNQVFTVGVSPALDKEASYNAYGHSIIANPWGEIIASGSYNEELIIHKINLEEITKVREELPLIKNRRTDIYTLK
ncbi:carbon-nitrogen hydrolase family protein [Methanobrevibacter sp. TMH8]|uniref:carbon-nitrogen hydrolase family protein n=1 Tax=Methanobrevibacter sp. TMH8 TaxID=2848611 RepID=UPI001CCC2C98|nr:carbon-nitrogen hydrolase family protein [Methanobrevibacter sp. TMH8]MBZ9571704.1 carbon-nitrogen hydrolase family protein [Methanobrevibacter sp. TMH8]